MRLSSFRAVQFGLGTVLVFAPLVLAVTDLLDARAAATVVSAALGLVLMGMAVATPRQGDELPPRNRVALDRVLVVVLVVAGILLAVLGDVGVGGICIACGLILGILASGTDYRERQGAPGDGATTVTSEP
jgi:hypothetical protein